MADNTLNRIAYLTSEKQRFIPQEILAFCLMPIKIETKSCISSNVEAYGYDNVSRVMKVVFKGGAEYRYLIVPEKLAEDMDASQSKGKFVAIIKGTAKAVRIDARWYALGGTEKEEKKIVRAASPCFNCIDFHCSDTGCGPENSFSLYADNNKQENRPAEQGRPGNS